MFFLFFINGNHSYAKFYNLGSSFQLLKQKNSVELSSLHTNTGAVAGATCHTATLGAVSQVVKKATH